MRKIFFLLVLCCGAAYTGIGQTQLFEGNWTKIGTDYNFAFNLHLRHFSGNQVEGHFEWTLVSYDKKQIFSASHYKDKVGKTATEYVRGTYNPKTKEYHLKGYKKEDPHQIIGIDEYRLKVDQNGDIGGDTKANNSWKGRINGKGMKPGEV